MENKNTIKLSKLKKIVTCMEQQLGKEDCEINFEVLMVSCFPSIMDYIQKQFTENYIKGYKEGYKDGTNQELIY